LASLTSKATYESAASAIEKARDHLYDVTVDPSSPLYYATEKSHDLLNEMEEALARCASQIENKIIGTMESTRPYISVEDLDVFILDWKTLARKHQVTPEQVRMGEIQSSAFHIYIYNIYDLSCNSLCSCNLLPL
jgi:hypothetical protein